jgi:hypothetical protein
VDIVVLDGMDGRLRGEMEEFFQSLVDERRTFVTTLDDVLRSEAVAVARDQKSIVGLSGVVRRFWLVPFRYNVVVEDFQGRGVAEELYRALLPRLNSNLCFFATVMNHNFKVNAMCSKLGYAVVHRGDRFTYLCNSKSPLVKWLISRSLRPFMPAALSLRRAWDLVCPTGERTGRVSP